MTVGPAPFFRMPTTPRPADLLRHFDADRPQLLRQAGGRFHFLERQLRVGVKMLVQLHQLARRASSPRLGAPRSARDGRRGSRGPAESKRAPIGRAARSSESPSRKFFELPLANQGDLALIHPSHRSNLIRQVFAIISRKPAIFYARWAALPPGWLLVLLRLLLVCLWRVCLGAASDDSSARASSATRRAAT